MSHPVKQNFLADIGAGGAHGARKDSTVHMPVNGIDVLVDVEKQARPELSTEERDGFVLVHCDFPEVPLGDYVIRIGFCCCDMQRTWAGEVEAWGGREMVSLALNESFETASNRFLPVVCNYNLDGENRILAGLADHVPLTHVNQAFGKEMPMDRLYITFRRFRTHGGFRETVVLSEERDHFSVIVQKYLTLCRELAQICPLPAPAWIREPVWSMWYAHLCDLTPDDV